jgi:hypothetical protein
LKILGGGGGPAPPFLHPWNVTPLLQESC